MLTHIRDTETFKYFASLAGHSSNQQPRPAKPISQRQMHILYIIARQKNLTVEGLEVHSRRIFNKGIEQLDRVEASDFMRHCNRNIIAIRR